MKKFINAWPVVASFCVAAAVIGCATPEASNSQSQLAPASNQVAPAGGADMTFTLPADHHPGLLDPSQAKLKAPDKFQAKFETTQGDFVIEVNREWAPNAADRFYSMVKIGFFRNTAIFRAVPGFMFQFGIHGVPEVAKAWSNANIKDDPAGKSNIRGTISFAQTGAPNSRSTQMFINLGNNQALDQARGGGAPFVPFGQVVQGKEIMAKVNTRYGENNPRDNVQGNLKNLGNAFVQQKFPGLDYIKSVTIVGDQVAGSTGKSAGSESKDAGSSKTTTGQ